MSENTPEDHKRDSDNNPAPSAELIGKEENMVSRYEKNDTRDHAERFAEAAEESARATQTVADATKAIAENEKRIADATIKSAEAAEASAKANKQMVYVSALLLGVTIVQAYYTNRSLKQSDASLKASIEASRMDQRAWVGVKSVALEPVEIGKQMVVKVGLSNSGRTYALDIEYCGRFYAYLGEVPDETILKRWEADEKTLRKNRYGVMFPGEDDGFVPFTADAKLASDADVKTLKEGTQNIYLIGVVKYNDAFREPHETRFFYRYLHRFSRFEARDKHNSAN